MSYPTYSDLELEIQNLEKENKNLTKCNLNLQEHIDKIEQENKILKKKYDWLTMYPQDMKELKEENIKLKEFLNITVQTKNGKIRNLLEELEWYKKQYEHSMGED